MPTPGEAMSDQHAKDAPESLNVEPETPKKDHRAPPRHENALSQIENATYAMLRKHEKHSL
jgi:hypothetical protein